MAIPSLQIINTETDTFGNWINKTNIAINAIRSSVLSASVIGDTTVGNATLEGTFTSTNLTANSLFRADRIQSRIGSSFIDMETPLRINSGGTQTTVSMVSTSGPRFVLSTGLSSWTIGYRNSTSGDLIIGQNPTTPSVSISPSGIITAVGFVGSFTGSLTGNSDTASRLQTVRTISMTGPVVWSVNFNGSSNISALSTIASNSISSDNIINNAITSVKFRQSVPLSVVGNPINSSANVSDIVAGVDGSVLRREGASVGFGQLRLGSDTAVSGVVRVINGGTGTSSFIENRLIVSGPSSLLSQSNLIWDSSNNRLGIGISPAQVLHVNGNILASGDIIAFSDERLKTNIVTIPNALEKVLSLRGVLFDKDGRSSIGLIAQELEEIIPEAVHDGQYKSVAYGNLVGLLIEAIKELKAELDANTNK